MTPEEINNAVLGEYASSSCLRKSFNFDESTIENLLKINSKILGVIKEEETGFDEYGNDLRVEANGM